MALEISAIQFNKIEQLRTDVNLQLNKRPIARGTVTEGLAWRRNGVKGGKTIFPVRFFSNRAKKRNPYEEVKATAQELVNFSHQIDEFAPDAEALPRGTQIADLYGIFDENLPTILAQAANEYDWHLANFLGYGQSSVVVVTPDGLEVGGPQDYDNLPFFHTAKLINPNRAAVGTFSNYEAAMDLDKKGLLTAFQKLDSVKGPDGKVMRMPGKLLVVVSNEEQYDAASNLLFGAMRAASVGNAAATEPNSEAQDDGDSQGGGLRGRAALVKLPDLADFDGGKGWYVFKICSAEYRPIVCGIAEAPQIYIEGISPNETSRVTRNIIRYGYRGFWGFGYLWPQLAFKAIGK